jgi:PAS domain S-box-containing protein
LSLASAATLVNSEQPRALTFWEQSKWQIAAIVALVVLQTLLIAGLLLERRRKKAVVRSLAESERRYRNVVETQTEMICRYLSDTTLTFANDAYCAYFGKSKDALIGTKFVELIPEHARDQAIRHIQTLLENPQPESHEHEVIRPDGHPGWHQWSNQVISTQGETLEFQGIGHDVTERKLAEIALRESEERNRAIRAAIPDLMILQSKDGIYLDCHAKDQGLLLAPPDQLIGKNMSEILPAELAAVFREIFDSVLESGTTQVYEYQLELQGERRWLETRITPCNGNKLLSIIRDVTESKQAREALIDSEEFNRRIVESSSDCIKILDLEGKLLYMSANGQKLLEIADVQPYMNSSWINLWGEEAKDLATEAVARAVRGEVGSFQAVGRTARGTVKSWDTVISPIRGARGQIDRLLAVSRDISERRALEENLRLSEREFLNLVENSPDVICRLDHELRFIYISPRREQKMGVPLEPFIGRTPSEISLDGFDSQGFEASCREALAKGKTVVRVFAYQTKTYSTRIIPEFSPDGSVESVMTISEDVSERIQAEKELLDLTTRLLNSQDQERRRIARELHDGTAQNLFGISINLAKLMRLNAQDVEAQRLIDESQSLGDQALEEIRTLSYLLHPPLLDDAGLVSALRWYVEGFNQRSGIFVDVIAQPIGRLPAEVEMTLFRVVQEALSNVRRHSGSETASIRLERRSSEVVLEICDHGHGLPARRLSDDPDELIATGVGIPGMRQRLRQLGGSLDIGSNGAGTRISAVVPLMNGKSHAANTSRG